MYLLASSPTSKLVLGEMFSKLDAKTGGDRDGLVHQIFGIYVIYVSIYLFIFASNVSLFNYLCIYLSIHLSMYLIGTTVARIVGVYVNNVYRSFYRWKHYNWNDKMH
jgi:hypothetical protein